jgi:hypothetical protein
MSFLELVGVTMLDLMLVLQTVTRIVTLLPSYALPRNGGYAETRVSFLP